MNELFPSDRELDALKILWERGEATVRDVFDALNSKGNELAYTTVLSLMQVMEQKGLVGHRPEGKAYVYFAKVQRDRTCRELAAKFLDKVFDGALDEYLVHAIESRQVTEEEIEQLEEMLRRTRSSRRRQSKKRPRR